MKKVIRLTESDLYRIVKRVISEQGTPTGAKPTKTTGGPTQNKVKPKKFMDFKWYATQVNNIITGMMTVTNIQNMGQYKDLKKQLPQVKANLDLYLKKLGKLIAPESSEQEQKHYADKFFSAISYHENGRKLTAGDLQGASQAALQNFSDQGTLGQVKQMLLAQIQKNKTTPVPST